MYTVLVKYVLPKPVPRAKIAEGFNMAEPMFRNASNLIRKYFCYDEQNHTGHSVYLWKSETDARNFFDDAFLAHFRERFGTDPEFQFIDTLMVVDNEAELTTRN